MQQPRLAYYVHGRGRGHASRALNIVPALRHAGYVVSLFGARDALPVLRELGDLQERPLLRAGLSGWSELLQRSWPEARQLRAFGIDAVISDGDQAALLGARLAGLPSLAIGHDLVFTRGKLPDNLDLRKLWRQRANALIPNYLSTRRVAVHFLPCESRDPHTRLARPVLDLDTAISDRRSERLVCYFRDGNGAKVVADARELCGDIVHADGKAHALHDRARFRQLLRGATGVIGSAGSNLLAECVLMGTPLLALYREDDSEQALNAQWLAAAHAGMACSFEQVDRTVIADFWQRAQAGRFAHVALAAALPSVVDAVLASLTELLSGKRERSPILAAH